MAKLHSRLAVIFFILSFISYVLDVSALRKEGINMLSSNSKSAQTHDQEQTGDSSFTVKLYTRDSLGLSPFKNNRYSTLARFKRDAARVNFISTKLNRVSQGDLSSPIISGKPSYEYFARFGIGTPSKPFYTAVDTGTDITWIQCLCNENDINSCYNQTDPFFEPSKSSSYKPLTCDAPKCQQLSNNYHDHSCTAPAKCNYQVVYGDNSTTVGGLATETFKSGSYAINDVAIGCGHNSQGKFSGVPGILALGLGNLSFPTQIGAKSFSYCLVNYNSTRAHSTLSFRVLMPSDAIKIRFSDLGSTYYSLSLTSIRVGTHENVVSRHEKKLRPTTKPSFQFS